MQAEFEINPSQQEIFNAIENKLIMNYGVETETVQMESLFKSDFGLDSLDIVEIVVDMEKKFDISIPDSNMYDVITIKDFVELIDSLI